jgi:hypothetical protein
MPKIFSSPVIRNEHELTLRRAETRQETSAPADAERAASDVWRFD